jgi:hypothetical protein
MKKRSLLILILLPLTAGFLDTSRAASSRLPQSDQSPANVRTGDDPLPAAVSFELDVMPILSARGCNSGPCHGKQRGQNGFQLSLLGFDPDFDFAAITKEARGRRVFPAAPEKSLLLQKPAGEQPHGGGKRIDVAGREYDTIRRWIETGMPRRIANEPKLERVTVEPNERIMTKNTEQQLAVTAFYSDGSTRDVTGLAGYQSSESAVAAVDAAGCVKTGPIPGEAAIMARYMGEIAVANVAVPLGERVPAEVYTALPRYNFIDEHVWAKLERLGVIPSEQAGDATFLRRAYIDVIGRLPTPDEAREFLADPSGDKRARLVDRLLERPEYADHWANKWADLLRPNPYRVGIKAVRSLDAFLRDSFRQNKPYDQFVRDIVTAQGSTWRNGAATVFRDRREPAELTTIVSQLFLGVRLECAKCHHHPFEIWGQDDFYGFAAFFGRVGFKGTGLSPPISGGEEMVYTAGTGSVKHPLTDQVLAPRPLGGEPLATGAGEEPPADPSASTSSRTQRGRRRRPSGPAADPENDPREALAKWMTTDDNPYFAKVMVNRVWADVMGRGLVEPVDDMRGTNPASNPELLDALANDFRRQGYDLKKLLKTILSSYVYGLSSTPNDTNVADTRNYSRHYRQRLRAEVLLDAMCDITGVPESFDAMPPGSRAMELWTHRSDSLFLDSFGRPDPNQDPPCERTTDTTVVQALHLMNAPRLNAKITADTGRAATLAATNLTPEKIVEQLYLLVYARQPTEDELKIGLKVFDDRKGNRRLATEDLLWALLNTPEFVFKD